MPTLLQSWLQNHKEYEASGRKLAIIAGSGGNAGAIGAGMVSALVKTSTLPPNATYIGISVGAAVWMYLLLAANFTGPTVFGRHLCTRRVFRPWRLLRLKHPFIDMHYTINTVLESEIPLPYTLAQTSPHTILSLTTNAYGQPLLQPLTGQPKAIVNQSLHDTVALPLIVRTNKLNTLAGWDGWLAEPQLLNLLHQQGITDVVWLLNRPVASPMSRAENALWGHVLRRLNRINPALATLLRQRLNSPDFLANPPAGMQLEVITAPARLSAQTTNSRQVFHALGTAYRHMAAYLGHPGLPYPTEWQPWQNHMPTVPNPQDKS